MIEAFQPLSRALGTPQPWMRPYAALAAEVLAHTQSVSVAQALNAVSEARGAGDGEPRVRFVSHDALPPGEAYEAFIYRTACVPTRENLHDLFNGLAWLRYPRTKQHFNRLQASEIARHGVVGARGPLRDALTVFDENGAVLAAPPPLVHALRERDWKRLFIEQRTLWQQARFSVFGHALLEKLMTPRKPITAHVWVLNESVGDNALDETLAATMSAEVLIQQRYLPLPVLGVPGWWPANAEPAFYDDAAVFRT